MTSLIVRNQNSLRNGRNSSAIDNFENLIDRFFNFYPQYPDGESFINMPVELIERDNNLIMKVMIPGMSKEDINIEVAEDQVTVSGEYNLDYQKDKDLIHRCEFCTGKFSRTMSLPQKIDHQKVKAEYKDGILTLNMPKSEKEINKKVKINL